MTPKEFTTEAAARYAISQEMKGHGPRVAVISANWSKADDSVIVSAPWTGFEARAKGQVAKYRHDVHDAAKSTLETGTTYWVVSARYDPDRFVEAQNEQTGYADPRWMYTADGPWEVA